MYYKYIFSWSDRYFAINKMFYVVIGNDVRFNRQAHSQHPFKRKKNAHFSAVIFFPTSFRFSTCSNIQIQTRVSQLHHSINSRRILHVSGITSDHKIQFDRSDMVQKI